MPAITPSPIKPIQDTSSHPVAGMLLTGGASRRMGFDKASMLVNGQKAAVRIGRLLASVTDPAIEVGPGHSGLPAVSDDLPGNGPLCAMASGWKALEASGHKGSVIIVACDLPLLSESILRWLVRHEASGSIVPVSAGRPQPLCALWSAELLRTVSRRVLAGARSIMGVLEDCDVQFVEEFETSDLVDPLELEDADTPDDLIRLGVA